MLLMDLHKLDLNLLAVFQSLFETRSVTLAAERQHITQPAMSNALARLRAALDDPLFVAGPGGMRPTPYAEQLAGPIGRALREVEQALALSKGFDPAVSEQAFRLHLTDFAQVAFLPPLLAHLRQEAPRIAIAAEALAADDIVPALLAGRIDFAFGRQPKGAGRGIGQFTLFHERYVVLMRSGHPLAGQPLTRRVFLAAEHALVCTGGHQVVEEALKKAGARIQLRLPSFLVVSRILAGADLLVTVPSNLARQCVEEGGFQLAELPLALPGFDIGLYWDASRAPDPAHGWMRAQLQALFGP